MNTPKEFFFEILTIINYQGNKSKFSDDFFNLSFQKALQNSIKDLPLNIQQKVENEFENQDDLKGTQELFEKYFDPKEYILKLENAIQVLLIDYLKTVYPALTSKQKEKLSQYLISSNIPIKPSDLI